MINSFSSSSVVTKVDSSSNHIKSNDTSIIILDKSSVVKIGDFTISAEDLGELLRKLAEKEIPNRLV